MHVQLTEFYRDIPLWALFPFVVAVVLLSAEAGYRLGLRRSRIDPDEKNAPIGGLVGAVLGFTAFLLAFTFGAGATRYDARRQLVLREANAIETAYLQADLLPGPERTAAREALVVYLKLRVQGVTALLRSDAQAQTAVLLDKLWSTAMSANTQDPDSPTIALFTASLNEVISLDRERLAAGRNRIPGGIWGGLLVLTVIGMAAMGFQFGLVGRRSWGEVILLALAFTLVIVLIVDLDRPQEGLIQVSQQPFRDLLARIAAIAP